MPSPSPHMLAWSEVQQQYELTTGDQPKHCFRRGDEPAWQSWLDEHTAFAFVGQAGRLSVLKEARSRGAGYWYAYRTQARHTHKRYLGPTARVTFARLEAAAKELTGKLSSAPLRPSPEELASSAHPAEIRREEPRPNASYQDEQRVVLLSPKLSHPRLSTPLVERERLLSELDVVRSHRLTLVSASAGSGKTTLLSTWATRSSQPQESLETTEGVERNGAEPVVAWLSLDSLDNDPIRFWSSVLAALRTRLPHHGQKAFALLHSSESPPLSTILTTLLQDLMEEDSDIILILDDYHVISDQAILDSMRFLIEHVPTNLHLVLATRTDPELPLSRLRVRSHLLEIRDRDLQFTQEEAASFLTQEMGLPLSEGEVVTLHQRTEGWIAGLQLAALSMRQRGDLSALVKDFAGSHRFLLDYVQQEILAQLPVPLQQFLLQTSILERMNAALCQAVAGLPSLKASQEMLEALERGNLFVVPLDDERQWYRYHDLFREALHARLQASQPQQVPLLHLRAARFYATAGELREAIAHALTAPDYSFAASLMEQAAESFWVCGEATTMTRWVMALPEQQVREHARLALTTALYLLNSVTQTTGEQRTRVHQHVRQLMARVETALLLRQANETGPSKEVRRAGTIQDFPSRNETFVAEEVVLQRHLHLLRTRMAEYEAIATWDEGRLSALHQEMQELDQDQDEDEEVIWQLLPLGSSFVFHYTIRQEGAVLVPRLLEARQRVSQSGSHFATTRVMQWLVMAQVEAGHLRQAYQESLAALALIEQITGYALLKGYFELVLGWVLYQWNRLEEARSRLHTVIEDAVTWQHSDLLLSGYLTLMQVELARGDLSAVQQALQGFEQLGEYQGYAYYWHWLPVMRAQWWLAQGQVNKAFDWAADVVFPQGAWDGHSYGAFPVVVRVYFAQRRWKEALDLLERWSGFLDRPGNIAITIQYLSQLLVALDRTGKSEQASEVVARLFALTEPEGHLRVYLDEGELMRQALLTWLTSQHRQHQPASSTIAAVSRVLAVFEQEDQQPSSGKEASTAPTHKTLPRFPHNADSHLPLEPLSPQEQRVLRLLVAGLTYAEMAQTLVVSPNTIKTQVSSIYRKLGVSRRAEAIARTSHLHLF